jgi:S-adenosylmethionine hydrolase
MVMKRRKFLLLLITITLSIFTSCQSATELDTSAINKNVTIAARIAAIDAYGNITLNILTEDLLEANFDYDNKIILEFSNGFLVESSLTVSNNNIEDGQCYIRTISKDNPITVSVKTKSLAEMGTLQIGDLVQLSQLIPN